MNKIIVSGTGLFLAACLFLATIIIVNISLTSWRLDLTENKLFTLSDGTINILNSLEEPITLKFYFSQKALTGIPSLANYGVRVRDMLQEYEAHANDMLELIIIDPETFSEEEDQAVASGIQGVAVNAAGDRAYLGLVGTNPTDDEKVIPFFQSNRESALEYDITKLIYNLAYPKKPVIGIISTLPVFGDDTKTPVIPTWTIISTMKEFFDVKDLGIKVDSIDPEVDVLMVIHPKNIKLETRFAIDQFVLQGGKAMVFVDPLSEADRTPPDPNQPAAMPDIDSELPDLLNQWGVEILKEKVAGDINAAMHVQTRGARGPREISYLPWLRLAAESFNTDDFSTSALSVLHMGTSGIIEKKSDSNITFTPLIQTTKQSMQLERDFLIIQRDPNIILENFKSAETRQTLAVRLQGLAQTAFPNGTTSADEDNADSTEKTDQIIIKEGNINVIVIADTDVLSDLFWIRTQSMFGMDIPQPISDNGNFIINSLDNMSGSNDLISLRSRGEFNRPFERVEAIRRNAELKFREREKQLIAKLEETEQKILKFQQEQGGESNLIMTPEQTEEMEKFRQVRLETRKELRNVQHELKKNIENLGTKLRIVNIGLIPLLIIIISLGTGIYRVNRKI